MNIKTAWRNWSAIASSTGTLIYQKAYALNPGKINTFAVGLAGGISLAANKICELIEKRYPYFQYQKNQTIPRTFAQLTLKSIVHIPMGVIFGFAGNLLVPSIGLSSAYGGTLGAISLMSPYIMAVILKGIGIDIKHFSIFFINPKTVTLDIDPETFEFEDKIWASLGFKMTNTKELKNEREKVTNKSTVTEKFNWNWNYMSIIANQFRVSLAKDNPYLDTLFKKVGRAMDMELSKKIFLATISLAKELSDNTNNKYCSDAFIGKLSWHVVNAIIVNHASDNVNNNMKKTESFSNEIENLFYDTHPKIKRIKMESSDYQFINAICAKVNNRLEDYSNQEQEKRNSRKKINRVDNDSQEVN